MNGDFALERGVIENCLGPINSSVVPFGRA